MKIHTIKTMKDKEVDSFFNVGKINAGREDIEIITDSLSGTLVVDNIREQALFLDRAIENYNKIKSELIIRTAQDLTTLVDRQESEESSRIIRQGITRLEDNVYNVYTDLNGERKSEIISGSTQGESALENLLKRVANDARGGAQ